MFLPLETPRLHLRALVPADFADFFDYAQDPAVSRPGMWEPYLSEAAAQEDFARILKAYERGLLWWTMEDRHTGKMIGRCQLAEYDADDARADLSYAMHRDFWRQGLMTEAARAVLDYGFEKLRLNRVGAQVFTDNPGSIRVLEKVNMTREGLLRHYRIRDGQPENVYIYSVLRGEWQK